MLVSVLYGAICLMSPNANAYLIGLTLAEGCCKLIKRCLNAHLFHPLTGVIIEGASVGKEAAFRKAIYSANERLTRTQALGGQLVSLNMLIKNIEFGDTFAASAAG